MLGLGVNRIYVSLIGARGKRVGYAERRFTIARRLTGAGSARRPC